MSKPKTESYASVWDAIADTRISDLLRGRISRFSLDALVNIATALGCRVHVELEVA
jgi:predicted XRE-type DNA-binding protein